MGGPRKRIGRWWAWAVVDGPADASRADSRWAPSSGAWLAPLVVALWLATHRYFGIVHDSRLYTVQALRALNPAHWDQDLYFQFGSQDSFTVSSALYGPLVGAVGPGSAHLIGVLLGAALWVSALGVFATSAFPVRRLWLAAVLGAIALNAHYAANSIFAYGEVFLTPRLYAEACVLLALGLALRGRPIFATLALLAGALLHPLMALVGAGALILYYAFAERRVWLLVGVGVLAGVGLAMAGVEPFARLTRVYDPDWFKIAYERDRLVFVSRWDWPDYLQAAGTLSVIFAMTRQAAPDLRRLLWAILATAVCGMTMSVIGADFAKNVLIVNLQLWRVQWLATLCANACLPVLFLTARRDGVARELFLITLVVSVASLFLWIPSLVIWGTAIAASLASLQETRTGASLSGVVRIALRLVAVALLGFGIVAVSMQTGTEKFAEYLLSFVVVVAIAALIVAAPRLRRSLVLALAVLVCGVALVRFDTRSDWQAFLETPGAPDDLVSFVGDAQNVYWETGPELLWFKLRRPSYFSCVQGAGSLFYRGTAMAYGERLEAIKPLRTRDVTGLSEGGCAFDGMPPSATPATSAGLAEVCGRLPDLDALVLFEPVSGAPARVWTLPTPRLMPDQDRMGEFDRLTRVYRYSCKDFRMAGAKP